MASDRYGFRQHATLTVLHIITITPKKLSHQLIYAKAKRTHIAVLYTIYGTYLPHRGIGNDESLRRAPLHRNPLARCRRYIVLMTNHFICFLGYFFVRNLLSICAAYVRCVDSFKTSFDVYIRNR